MKKCGVLLIFLLISSVTIAKERKISGKVTDGIYPLDEVRIRVLDNNTVTETNDSGIYEIIASEGQIIEYSHYAMKTVRIRVEDVTRILNIEMNYNPEELDEVVLEEDLKKRDYNKYLETQYLKNKHIIKTVNGYIDASISAGFIKVLSGGQVGPKGLCFLSLLESRFPNLIVTGNCVGGNARVTTRRFSGIGDFGTNVIFDVDGQIFREPPVWLFTNDIEKIAVINGSSGTASFYSSFGVNAVVIVNTAQSVPLSVRKDNVAFKDSKLVFSVLEEKQIRDSWPEYLKNLHDSSSLEEAKQNYNRALSKYTSSPHFFLDVYRYFCDTWDEEKFADEIIATNLFRFQENPVHLKALAYIYDDQGRFGKSNMLYKEIFMLRPNYAQSYYDMANSYANTNQYKKALSIYSRFDYLIKEGFIRTDVLGFTPILKKDYENLIVRESSGNVYLDEENKSNKGKTRVTFEWSDSETEFEISFINANKSFSKIQFNLEENEDMVLRSKDYGYSVFEKFISNSFTDDWTIYVNYLGNKSLTPSYLKVTVCHNYASKDQKIDISTFKLFIKNKTTELININKNQVVVLQ